MLSNGNATSMSARKVLSVTTKWIQLEKNLGNNLVDKDVLRVIRWIGLEPSVTVPPMQEENDHLRFSFVAAQFCEFLC